MIRLTLLLLVGVGSAAAYVALTMTINGVPPYHPFPGWVAVLQPSSERGGDKVGLEVASDASAFSGGRPFIAYSVTVCGSHPYTGELLIGGKAEITKARPFPTPPTGVAEPTLHRLPDLILEVASQLPAYSLGAVQELPIKLGYVPPCSVVSSGQSTGGSALGIAGYASAPIQQNWTAPFRMWHGPAASQAWPLTGTLPGPLSGKLGQFQAISGLRNSWDLAYPQSPHVQAVDLPLTETINSALPATTDPGTLDWRSSNSIWPLARITNNNYLSTLQTGAAICTVCFGIAGAWLASLTFGWLDPRRSRATAPTSTLDTHKPLPSAVQPQQSALNQRNRGEDRHRTAMVMAFLIIATVLRRLFSNRSS